MEDDTEEEQLEGAVGGGSLEELTIEVMEQEKQRNEVKGKDIGLEIVGTDMEPHEFRRLKREKINLLIDKKKLKLTFKHKDYTESEVYSLLYSDMLDISGCYRKVEESAYRKTRGGRSIERTPPEKHRDPRLRKYLT